MYRLVKFQFHFVQLFICPLNTNLTLQARAVSRRFLFPRVAESRWEERRKRRGSNLRNKWRNFGAKNMSEGSAWKTRCVRLKSLPSRIYSRRCRMQHHRPRSQFTKTIRRIREIPPTPRKLGRARWRFVYSSREKLLREIYAPNWIDAGKVQRRLLLRGAVSKCHFSGGEWRDRW